MRIASLLLILTSLHLLYIVKSLAEDYDNNIMYLECVERVSAAGSQELAVVTRVVIALDGMPLLQRQAADLMPKGNVLKCLLN